jgi:hypothetical protein
MSRWAIPPAIQIKNTSLQGDQLMRVRRLSRTNDVETFYGNGKIFLLLGDDCRQFAECNFAMEPLQQEGSAVCYELSHEIVVCCGSGATRKRTIQALQALIGKIEAGECDPRT